MLVFAVSLQVVLPFEAMYGILATFHMTLEWPVHTVPCALVPTKVFHVGETLRAIWTLMRSRMRSQMLPRLLELFCTNIPTG